MLAHSPRIVTDGLVLCLDAANTKSYPGSGTTWTDLSGRGNNGTLVNGVGYSGDNLGSLSFDGVDDYVNLGASSNLTGDNLQTLTLSQWIYPLPDSGVPGTTFVVKRVDNSSLFRTAINTAQSTNALGDYIGFLTRNNANTGGSFLTVSITPYLNTWVNLAITIDGMSRKLYINGNLEGSDSDQGMQSVVGSSAMSSIGAFFLDTSSDISNKYPGRVAHTLFYRIALTAQEIQQNFNALKSRYQ